MRRSSTTSTSPGPALTTATSVEGMESPTWDVTFVAGAYKYVCDPHADFMRDSFTVT